MCPCSLQMLRAIKINDHYKYVKMGKWGNIQNKNKKLTDI